MKNEKSEHVHFFMVPKAEVKKWQHALLRTDIVVKPGQSVCHKHFPEKDILWRRELRGPDGTILGVVGEFTCQKLDPSKNKTLLVSFSFKFAYFILLNLKQLLNNIKLFKF